jgi:hypothetical protein
MGRFKASVQYGDWEGTAKADDIDKTAIREYLKQKGLMKPSEFLLGLDFSQSGEPREGGRLRPPIVRCFFLEDRAPDFGGVQRALSSIHGPIPVRVRDVKLTLGQFFRLFKRFSVVLTARDLALEDREYEEIETPEA